MASGWVVSPAGAWNALGHRTVAELAWRQMDQAERREATELLKHHPHYSLLLTAEVPAGVDTNEWAFLTAAVWPDLTRPAKKGEPQKPDFVTKYNVFPHGIDLPFVRPGDKDQISLKKFSVPRPNAQTALMDSLATLKNAKASAHDRAVSLAWVLHLCGDLHQPLHAATLVTRREPKGNGAGGVFVLLDPEGNRINIHTFWDYLPGSDFSYASVTKLANELAAAPELQPSKMKEYRKHKSVPSWAQESLQSAVNFGYAEEHIQFVHSADLASGEVPASALPRMSADYAREARDIAHSRLVLAAQRLTDSLKRVW